MTLVWLLLLLALLSGLVAYLGDRVAKWVGKRHWRLFRLRPRQTATLVAVATGVVIGLMGFGLFLLVNRQARETILEAEAVRQERDALLLEKARLQEARSALEAEAARALAELNRLRAEGEERALLLERAEARRTALEGEVARLKGEVAGLLARQRALEARLAQLSQEAARKEEALREKERQVGEKEAALRALESALRSLEATRARLEEEARQARREKEALLKDLQAQTEALAALRRERDRLLSEREALQKSLAQARREAVAQEERLRSLQAQTRALEERQKALSRSLDRVGQGVRLGGVRVEGASEVLAFAERQARLLGFSGAVVRGEVPGPGYAVLEGQGVEEGRLRVGVRFYPRRKAFPAGTLLAFAELPSPGSERFLKGLEALHEKARARLVQAGFPPDLLAFSREEALAFQASLRGVQQGLVVGVAAGRDLWTTDPPDLLYLALFTLP
jgi:hypothetical protein